MYELETGGRKSSVFGDFLRRVCAASNGRLGQCRPHGKREENYHGGQLEEAQRAAAV